MLLDYITLAMAIGISTTCLSVMIFAAWLAAPEDSFLLTFAVGGALCGAGALLYGFYVADPRLINGVIALSVILCGQSVLVGSGYQFRTQHSPGRLIAAVALGANALALPWLGFGYSGFRLVPGKLAIAVLMFAMAWQYWGARSQAFVAVAGLCVFYSLIGLSFILCAAVLVVDGNLVIEGAPHNWAEDLSLLTLVACVPGIGAVILSLNQARLARMHRESAMTDPLTGLLNRRALFDAVGTGSLPEGDAVLVFDIDRFKKINDRFGHSVGDRVINAFARVLEASDGATLATRLGGEEFAVVMPSASIEAALSLADDIRDRFAASIDHLAIDNLEATVSAGIAFSGAPGATFESVLIEADKALYAAKNSGRDRALPAEPGMVV